MSRYLWKGEKTVSQYKYEDQWTQYAFEKSGASFADSDEIKQAFTRFNTIQTPPKAAGLPVLCDAEDIYVNTDTEMSIIFGETGSKKTRCLIAPLICLLAEAGESMIITDVKGELSSGALSSKVRGVLEKNNYNTVFLNFRDLNCDSYNILEYAYRLYKNGETDKSMMEVSNIISTLGAVYTGTNSDPFWVQTASAYLLGVTLLVFAAAPSEREINMMTIASYNNDVATDNLSEMEQYITDKDNAVMTMLKSVLSEPEKTRMSTIATAAGMLQSFLNNEALAKMMGQSSFDVSDIYKKKTALFVILPDEVNTYDKIAGIVMRQISAFLVSQAYELGGSLPRRVNFIYDEFCNIFAGDGSIGRALSTHRSRNIRYYLVCQGLEQLRLVHPKDSATILTNCKNIYYLNSSDRELLKYLSEGSGETYENPREVPKPLLSVYDLQTLEKTFDYAECYIKSGKIQFVTKLYDIDKYKSFESFKQKYSIPVKAQQELSVYNSGTMRYDIESGAVSITFNRKPKKVYQTLNDLFD